MPDCFQIHHSTWECESPEQATAASSTIEYANANRDCLPHHIPVTAARFRGGQGEIHCFQQFCKCTERCNMYREVAQMCSQARSACHNSGLSVENSRLMKGAFCAVPEWLSHWQVVNSCYKSYMPYIKAWPE